VKQSFVFIGRCFSKQCRTTVRVTVPSVARDKWTRGIPGVPGSAEKYQVSEPAWAPRNLGLECVAHRYPLRWQPIEGRTNPDHKCDARCIHARGPNCDCSCGGANHGAAYS